MGINATSRAAALLLAVTASLILAAGAGAADRHVDCQASPVGADGSSAKPWTELADATASPLAPGDRVLIARGTVCSGSLEISDSGTAQSPISVEPYGSGEARPRIDGTGPDAVRLDGASHLSVSGLEVTNPGDGTTRKRGIHLVTTAATTTGVRVTDNYIHDVGGDLAKDGGGSGGIQVDSDGGLPARYDQLLIEGNRIEDVSRSGIFINGIGGGVRPRASEPWPEASAGVRVTGNRIDRVAGDGIVTLGTDGALLDHNVVSRGNLAGRPLADPAGMICNAGIWAFNANNTTIEHNEVFGMEFNGCDGSGFDVDYMQDGTTIQFNYSHDNEGGFLLLCTDSKPRTSTVRFNFSLNDGLLLNSSPCNEPTGSYSGIEIYNNTLVAHDPAFAVLGNKTSKLFGPASLTFFNNIVVATGGATGFTCEPNCRNNLFHGLPTAGQAAVSADPRFVNGSLPPGPDAAEGYRLAAGSPAFGAGTVLPANVTADYFGAAPVSFDRPNIGFDLSAEPQPPMPYLTKVRLLPRSFRAARGRGPALDPRGRASLSFRLNLVANIGAAVYRKGARKPLGYVKFKGKKGYNSRKLTGRVGGRPLRPGRYRMIVTPRTASVTGIPFVVRFRILRPR